MKKKFTILISAALMLLMMMAQPGTVLGQNRVEEVAYTLEPASGSNNAYANNCDIVIDGITWNLTGNSTFQPWRIGGKSLSGVDRPLYSKTAISDNITKIEVTHGNASSITINSWTVIVASDADFSNVVSTLTPTFTANATTTITRPDGVDWTGCYYKFVYNVTVSVSSNKFLEFTRAKFYKELDASAPDIEAQDVEIAYDATSGVIAYTINNPVSGGALTATTESDWLTLGSVGTTVPFTCTANSTAIARTATVTLTYTYNTDQTVTNSITVTQLGNPNASGGANNPYSVAEARAAIDAGTGVTGVYATGVVSQVDSYNSNYYSITYWISDDGTTTNQLEAYGGISGIEGWTFQSKDDIKVGATVVIRGNLTKYNTTYEFALNNELVSYIAPAITVATPTFSPAGGTYTEVQTVTISCETEGVDIYYTTDGSTPTMNSDMYEGPITVNATMTIKAIAVNGDDVSSDVATAEYIINLPYSGQAYARVDNVSYLTDGVKVVLAARFDNDETKYYAMTNAATGKPTGVLFTSTTSGDFEVLPAEILNAESAYCWTVGVTTNGYTFTNANGQTVGWTSGTNFATGGDNMVWTVEIGTSGENAMVPNYRAFNIINYNTINANTVRAFALNNNHNFGPYALSNNNSADYNFSIDIFVQGAEPTPTPIIEADNVNIDYNATSGTIEYTVSNTVEGGTVSVNISAGDWLTLGQGTTSPISFTCTANSEAAARTAIVALSYSVGTEVLATKEVTITQDGNPSLVNNISDITDVNANYHVAGTVVAINNRGFIIGDGTGYVYTYLNAVPTQTVGDMLSITGNTGTYGHVIQFTDNAELETVSETNYDGGPAYTVITEIPDYSEGYHLSNYFQFEGNLTKSGDNYLVAVGTGQIRISYPTSGQQTELSGLLNKTVRVHGFFTGISGSGSNAVFTVMMESIEEVPTPTISLSTYTVDVDAGGGNGIIEVTFTNFVDIEPEVQFFAQDGATTATYDWITVVLNSENNAVYTVEANNGEARTAYFKVSEQSEGLSSNLVTVNQAKYVVNYATLPFEFDGGRADIATTNGLTQEGLDSDYGSSPKLKFNSAGDYVLLHFIEEPGTLTFDIKGNSFSGSSTFKVQTSEDGETYTDLETYTELGAVQSESIDSLGANVRYIKWIYTVKDGGNVALGNIHLYEAGGGPAPVTYDLTVEPFENLEIFVFVGGDETNVALDGAGTTQVTEGDQVMLSITAVEGYELQSLMVDGQEHVGDIADDETYTFTMPNHNVTVNASAVSVIPPTPFEPVTYTLATSIESGKSYIIVGSKTEGDSTMFFAMGEQRDNNRGAYAISMNGNTATVETENVHEVVINALENNFYSIFDGGYLYAAGSNKNHLKTQDSLDVNGQWEISIDETNGQFSIVASNSNNRNVMQFNYNGGNPLFSCYSSASQSPVYLYEKYEAPTTVTQTITLASGANWCSFYVEITLNDLKAALVTAYPSDTISIKSKNSTTTYNPRNHRWTGNINDFNVGNMYKVITKSDGEITLEGMPADPANHPVTIKAGNNYIAFPFNTTMTPTNAFAGFAVTGDKIKSKTATSLYNRGKWGNQIPNLEPGQGYIYIGTDGQADRTLVFPSSK